MKLILKLNDKKVRVALLVIAALFLLSGCISQETYSSPIAFEGSFFSKFIVYPVGLLLYKTTEVFGGNFPIGILATTLIIRTLAWPIYAKGTQSTMKTQEMQPELQKLQAKYAGKNDTHSQQRYQAEVQALYKKHGVSILGCLTPFLQMPIFLAIYSAVIRLPQNLLDDGTTLVLGEMSQTINPELFGLNLFVTVRDGISTNFLYIIIPILSAGSMILMQMLMLNRQKKNKVEVPEYRRNTQADAMAKQMKFMTIAMSLMFAFISFTSVATLGFYWTIGNFYSLAQQQITQKLNDIKKAKGA